PALVRRPAELAHARVDLRLVVRVLARARRAQLRVRVLHRLEHALAGVALAVPVAQLHRLARAGGGARGHRRPAEYAAVQDHLGFDGGVAARVDDLAPADVGDSAHRLELLTAATPRRALSSPPGRARTACR